MVRKILIIDDDEPFVETTRERLDFEGYEVVSATDGDEGLDAVERERPDLVVLDIMMPKLNGYAFLKMLKSRHPEGKIAVVICTARGDVMDAVKSEGISGFLVKPFDPAELVSMVNVTFQLQEASREKRKADAGIAQATKPRAPKPAAASPPPEPKPEPKQGPGPKTQTGKAPEAQPEETKEAPAEVPARKSEPESQDAGEPAAGSPAEKQKILIIDDEKDFVEGLKDRLAFEGYEVVTAYNGQDGLELTRREKPNLILLDVMMPKIDGYMVCRLLKFDEKYQGIPIIMLTARSLDEDRDLGLSSGADDYTTKPIDFDVLLKKIRSFLAVKPQAK
ncbi:MAG TPA: response regulator [bacterium]|nr:response regulator [bacterium]